VALKIKELHHQGLATPSAKLADMLAFYTGVLGMTPDPGRPDKPGVPAGAWLYVGPEGQQTSQVHVIARDGVSEMANNEREDPTRTHLALAVDDITEAEAELVRMGVPHWSRKNTTGPVLFVDDPLGNMIEIHQADTCRCSARALRAAAQA
jgi:catechol 2,3-dioxygenase-like lactoylglutathione lyase family enzyme